MVSEQVHRTAPYVGLEPYNETDRAFFFGRDREAKALEDQILASPITVLFAPSGAGKSSLLRARIIPEMHDLEALVVYVSQWVASPIAAIRAAVVKAVGPTIAGEGDKSLLALAQALNKASGQGLVLVFDQFEQFFLRHPAQVGALGAELAALARSGPDAHIVLALREEFLPRLDAFRDQLLGIEQARYRLGPLTGKYAIDAIVSPLTAELFHGTIEDRLVNKLLADLQIRSMATGLSGAADSDTGISLPFLQIVCRYLWDAAPGTLDRHLTVAQYDKLGGYKGVVKAHVRESMKQVEGDDLIETANLLDRLAPRAGVKMAYDTDDLANRLGISRARLDARLAHLEEQRIVHNDKDGHIVELFHDAYTDVLREFIEEVLGNVARKAMIRRRNQHIAVGFGLAALVASGAVMTQYWTARREPAQLADSLARSLKKGDCNTITRDVDSIWTRVDSKPDWLQAPFRRDREEFLDRLVGALVSHPARAARCPEPRVHPAELSVSSPIVLRYNPMRPSDPHRTDGGDGPALALQPGEIQNLWQRLVDRLWEARQIQLATTISVVTDYRLPAWSYTLEVDEHVVWRRPIPEQQGMLAIVAWSPRPEMEGYVARIASDDPARPGQVLIPARPSAMTAGASARPAQAAAQSVAIGDTFVRLAPAWSAPIWQQIGQRYPLDMVPGVEAKMTFDVFESVAEQPELYFTERLTRKLMAIRQATAPCLVYAALDRFVADAPPAGGDEQAERRAVAQRRKDAFARMLPRVHRVLVEAARRGHPSGMLTRILDRLADLPANSPEVDPGAIATWLAQDDGRARPPSTLVLSRRRQVSWDCPGLDPAEMLGEPDSSEWDDVASKLELRETPIRVRMGAPLVPSVVDGALLRPETLEMLYGVQRELSVPFGVLMPGVRFVATEWPEARFRIEISGWDSPITASSTLALATLKRALRDAVARSRLATVAVDTTLNPHLFLEANRMYLYGWIEARFSRNDIKLLLRGTLAPDAGAAETVKPERTIRYLPWLLDSLPFWELACEGVGRDDCLVRGLRDTQKARLAGAPLQEAPVAIADGSDALIARGIAALENDDPSTAVEMFTAAIQQGPNRAGHAFLRAYPQNLARLAKLATEKRCTVPEPGRPAWGGNSRAGLAPIEDAIELHVDPAQRAHLRLCALMHQIPTQDEASDVRKIQRFLAERADERAHWTQQERYWLVYQLLDANARVRPPAQPASADRKTAQALLATVLGVDGLAPPSRDRAVGSLADVCQRHHSDPCFWDLVEVVENSATAQATPSSDVLLRLVQDLLALPNSGTQARLDRIGKLVDRAAAGLDDITDSARRGKLSDLLQLFRLAVDTQLLTYGHQGAAQLLDRIEAFQRSHAATPLLVQAGEHVKRAVLADQGKPAEIRASLDEEHRNWPALDLRDAELDLAVQEDRFDDAVKLSDDLLADSLWKNEDMLFLSAISRLMVQGEPNSGRSEADFSGSAERLLLFGGHRYRDYVRLILYWRLMQRPHQGEKARGLLDQRLLEIPDPEHDTPDVRLAEGDLSPWRDKLVRYYSDPSDANRRAIFDPLNDRAAFEHTVLASAGQSFSSFRCEAYFYDALVQSITGDVATRRQRYTDDLRTVVRERCFDMYEYHMASWLLRQPAGPR